MSWGVGMLWLRVDHDRQRYPEMSPRGLERYHDTFNHEMEATADDQKLAIATQK